MTGDHTSKVDAAKKLAELRQNAAEREVPEAEEGFEFEQEEDAAAYSLISADRQRKVMVQFRLLAGTAKARAYAFLVGIDFDPSAGIVMDFTADKVLIEGRNLWPLFEALAAQRVAVVCELDDMQAEANLPHDATVVIKIDIVPVE